MEDYLEIGTTPCDEDCAQVGRPDYHEKSMEEAKRYIRMLKVKWPNARLGIKTFRHDFGSYREVVVKFSNDEEAAIAFDLESNLPAQWNDWNF